MAQRSTPSGHSGKRSRFNLAYAPKALSYNRAQEWRVKRENAHKILADLHESEENCPHAKDEAATCCCRLTSRQKENL